MFVIVQSEDQVQSMPNTSIGKYDPITIHGKAFLWLYVLNDNLKIKSTHSAC